jgi:16S rRNA (cytidine1402-2'-O)-methyltransferase
VTEPEPAEGGATLHVVATPIGNLGDITLRALEVLRRVPLVAAEDTRVARRLLARYEIDVRTVSFHARNTAARMPELLDHLRRGEHLALVTDAGTPSISDPGEELVRRWAAEGGRVEALPGASAVTVAVAASGVAGPRWTFEGFLPRSGRERRKRLAAIAADERGCVVFEAPGRVAATLADLAEACGGERQAAVCRELTKVHEQVERGSLAELAQALAGGGIPARGEFVIVIGTGQVTVQAADPVQASEAVDRLVAEGVAPTEAARRVAAATGLSRRGLYRAQVREPGAR